MGLLIDAIVWDLKHGGNVRTREVLVSILVVQLTMLQDKKTKLKHPLIMVLALWTKLLLT